MSVIFECRDLVKSYGKVTALKGISLQLESGRIVGLLGPNGSGKTTLIKLANRLLQPTSGELRIAGEAPGVKTKAAIAYLPDKDFLPDWMKTDALLKFYGDFFPDFDHQRAKCPAERRSICWTSRSPVWIRLPGITSFARFSTTMKRMLWC